jgi:Rod binding domain-containing protein
MISPDSNAIASAGISPGEASGPSQKALSSPDEQKLKKAAGEFESILLASMWKSMKQSFGASETDDTDPAHGTLDDWGIEVMSGAVGKAGGLGIGRLILEHLDPKPLAHGAGAAPGNSAPISDKTK